MEGITACGICLRSLNTPVESLNGYLPDNFLKKIKFLPFQNQVYQMPKKVLCGNCKKVYCSIACRDEDLSHGHQLLCFSDEELQNPENSFSIVKDNC